MDRILILLALCLTVFAPVSAEETSEPESKEVTYSELRKLVDDGIVEKGRVSNDGWWVTVYTNDGAKYYAPITPQTPIADHLYDAGVPVRIEHIPEDEPSSVLDLFYNLLPFLIFLVFIAFVSVVLRRANKKTSGLYAEYLKNAKAQNDEHLLRIENLHKSFLDRLEAILTQTKHPSG